MRRPSTHAKLLSLLCLLLVGIPLLLAGCGAVFSSDPGAQAAEAFDRVVPGLTRAEDLAGIGLDLQGSELLSAADIARRFASEDTGLQACVEAGLYCTGYLLHSSNADANLLSPLLGKPKPVQVALLVMNGRVVGKVLSHDSLTPGLRVASASAF